MEAKEITATFEVAMSTINQHVALAASSHGTGRAALEYVHFEIEGDRVHIVSTDGRVMLHTDARSNGGIAERSIAFDVRAMPKASAKKAMMGAESDVIFTVKDGVIFSGDIVARVTTGIDYPTWRDVIPVRSRLERETSWKALNPKYCALALKFVGGGGYARPYRVTGAENSPVVFLNTPTDTDELNTAVVMPIRTEVAE